MDGGEETRWGGRFFFFWGGEIGGKDMGKPRNFEENRQQHEEILRSLQTYCWDFGQFLFLKRSPDSGCGGLWGCAHGTYWEQWPGESIDSIG